EKNREYLKEKEKEEEIEQEKKGKEEELRGVFREKNREYLKEKEKEEEIEQEKKGKEEELRGVFRNGTISDFAKVLRRKSHLDVLKDDLDKQVEKVIEASKLLEEQRAKLIISMKDKKIMEKHKEKKFDEYNKIMQDLELKFMDEIATERFKHEDRD
ncbi:hypothetical protein A3F86_05695, partial [candidate division WOR-1 bacterium RIFCSPLOWO2_12_FULL_45_9]